ncbi:Spastin [Zea mays]|uniref:Spastin n=1 Tax=Zea mays TaxID=4577 RepID=A0A3L6EAR7_MAIZE|nr:Spastin [Zea mays]
MSFLRSLANSFSSLLFSSGGETAPMDAAGSAPSPAAVVMERVAVKLRGYFDLAKEEMDKAVRAEEWGLPDDATAHYRNAMRVMLEAQAARVPDAVSSSERGQVRVYQEKIAKWQAQVEERLRVLGQRSAEGATAAVVPKKIVLSAIKTGATNKPQELDDAVLRRLVKRIYVPLPDPNVRRLLLKNQLKGQAFKLSRYSGSDLRAVCEEAAMMPIRELGPQSILAIKANQLRPLKYEDFKNAMAVIRPSLQKSKWDELEKWNEEFGSS